MKLVIGFILGLLAFGLAFLGVRMATVAVAETDDATVSSDNATQSVLDILPDFEKIYRVALTLPFQKAESKIYDEDISLIIKIIS